jgi:hypothetical protein
MTCAWLKMNRKECKEHLQKGSTTVWKTTIEIKAGSNSEELHLTFQGRQMLGHVISDSFGVQCKDVVDDTDTAARVRFMSEAAAKQAIAKGKLEVLGQQLSVQEWNKALWVPRPSEPKDSNKPKSH